MPQVSKIHRRELKRPSTKLHSEAGNDNDDDVNDDNDDNDYHDGCDDDMCQDVNMSRATFQRIAFRDQLVKPAPAICGRGNQEIQRNIISVYMRVFFFQISSF